MIQQRVSEQKSHVGMATCFLCGGVKHIMLDMGLKNTLPREACYDYDPCDTCIGYMKQGIILISVRDGEDGVDPYRTGGWVVVREEVIRRLGGEDNEVTDKALKRRAAFIPDTLWGALGLPKGKCKEVSK